MKVGVLGLPGAWSTERLADAFERRGCGRHVLEAEALGYDAGTGRVMAAGRALDELDAVVVKKLGRAYGPHLFERLALLAHAESGGLSVFSRPANLARALSRIDGTLLLLRAGLPVPEVVLTPSVDEAVAAVERFGRAVLKPLYSTKARGMRPIEAGPDVRAAVASFAALNPLLYVQRRVDLPGRDLGLVFVGGAYVGTYARVRGGDAWATTTAQGGRYAPAAPSAGLIALAERAQAVFGLDLTVVDVAETPEGPVVFEVSAFGGYRGLFEASGVDASEAVADHVLASRPQAGRPAPQQ
jgi:ribosomal protein S6--L-glutamate ligase